MEETCFGFWISWLPFSVAQCWPFCYWVAAVVDVYSRRVQGIAVFRKEPTARRIRSFLSRVVSSVGKRPRYLISDHDPVFDCEILRAWCGRTSRHRFGAVGQKGSIAIIERFFLSLKNELTRVILVSLSVAAFRREALYYMEWFNTQRPHAALEGKTPQEAYEGREMKMPNKIGGVICLEFYKRRRHLPVVTSRRVAA